VNNQQEPTNPLAEWLATLEPLDPEDAFPEVEDFLPEPVTEILLAALVPRLRPT
jgi:hypothetical protein